MRLWGIKYMDMDERWWIDVILREEQPEVGYLSVGSELFCDGFKTTDGLVLARKVSVQPIDLADWPTDSPVALRPSAP